MGEGKGQGCDILDEEKRGRGIELKRGEKKRDRRETE